MPRASFFSLLPNKIGYRINVSFCLMSLIPILAGIYVISFLLRPTAEAGPSNLPAVSVVAIFSLSLSLLGYKITKQFTRPIENASRMAKEIARGYVAPTPAGETSDADLPQSDEIQELTRSLQTISLNAKELLEKVERLSFKDKLTGLYNGQYIRERLEEEINRAIHYQRPCSFAYFSLDQFAGYELKKGRAASEEAQKAVAGAISAELAEFDRAAHISPEEFVVIFPDRNKKNTIEIVSRIIRAIEALPCCSTDSGTSLKVRAGISENPLDGVKGDELFAKAQKRVRMARQADQVFLAQDA